MLQSEAVIYKSVAKGSVQVLHQQVYGVGGLTLTAGIACAVFINSYLFPFLSNLRGQKKGLINDYTEDMSSILKVRRRKYLDFKRIKFTIYMFPIESSTYLYI